MFEKLKFLKDFILDNMEKIIVFGIIMLLIGMIGITIWACVDNANNEISEGVVIDKDYSAAHTLITYTYANGIRIPHTQYYPESFTLTIRGTKSGETVEYRFEVPESEYERYNIGDYYGDD